MVVKACVYLGNPAILEPSSDSTNKLRHHDGIHIRVQLPRHKLHNAISQLTLFVTPTRLALITPQCLLITPPSPQSPKAMPAVPSAAPPTHRLSSTAYTPYPPPDFPQSNSPSPTFSPTDPHSSTMALIRKTTMSSASSHLLFKRNAKSALLGS